MASVTSFAHGRVNLIGEHTDYNGGWVFPTAIPQKTTVVITPRADREVRAHAGADPKSKMAREASYRVGEERLTKTWIDYVQGVTFVLRKAGHPPGGFDVQIESSVPEGSGLSSSAALEIALLKGLREAFSLPLDDVELAKLGQKVENDFVGARVGIMDQMACLFAKAGEALFLDTRELTHRNVSIPLDQVELVVVNSGVSHALSAEGEGYNKRRAQCEEACEKLGVKQLRDLGVSDLPKLDALPEIIRRRAKHVITENDRVHRAVDALERRDFKKLGELFYDSHASMRDDYAVSVPEIDLLVELARADRDVYGARLTGGGFGGSIVALVKAGSGNRVGTEIVRAYHEKTGKSGTLLVP